MSHNVADGLAMVEAVQQGKRIFQAGSQRVSNIVYKKAAEIYASGRLGEVTYIEGHPIATRRRARGSIRFRPMRARRPSTGRRCCAMRPQRPFDAVRFFRWRCFADYGEGVAGDLYVHLLSGIQCVSGINAIPSRAYSSAA